MSEIDTENIEQYKNIVKKLIIDFEPNKIDYTIYHYCSLSSFMAIVESKCMHLSNSFTLNDYTENRIIDSLYPLVKNKLLEMGKKPQEIEHVFTECKLNTYPMYVACFSKIKDLLSQWRGYGDDGYGVSIGFRFSKDQFMNYYPSLTDYQDLNFSIYEMQYINDGGKISSDLFVEILAYVISKYMNTTGSAFLGLWNKILKNEGFHEEHEVRIACVLPLKGIQKDGDADNLVSIKINHEKLKYKSKRDIIQPYLEFPFKPENIEEIVLGPRNRTEAGIIQDFLESQGVSARISKSSIPYY